MAQKMLVVAADIKELVSGCGATLARYTAQGDEVYAGVLTGERTPLAQAAATTLGLSNIHFYNWPSNPLSIPTERINLLATLFREVRPDFIVTHSWEDDPWYPDHSEVRRAVMAAYQAASGAGYIDGNPVSPRQTPIFGMEPHDPTGCGFRIFLYIPADDRYHKKLDALSALRVDKAEKEALIHRNQVHADQYARMTNCACTFAEVFSSFGPVAKANRFVW